MYFSSELELYDIIGQNIKYYRNIQNITQQTLAERSQLSLSYISKVEAKNCDKSLSIYALNQIANALGIDISLFFKEVQPNMKLETAKAKISKLANIPFSKYLTADQLQGITINKGKSGQLLELTIGLKLSNTTLDFEDGELKTNKCDSSGTPKETMFITQIASMIDELLEEKEFKYTKLYKKLQHLLYVPISKDGEPQDWMFLPCIEIDLSLAKYSELAKQLESDYYSICKQMNQQLQMSSTATLHTVNGKFIQIRTKDSKPYTPIYSEKYKRFISDKNRAFYFKKEFMHYIVNLEKH